MTNNKFQLSEFSNYLKDNIFMKLKYNIFMKYSISVTLYFMIFLVFSLILTKTLPYEHEQIPYKENYIRLFDIIPLRESIGIPPASFLVWWFVTYINKLKIPIYSLFLEGLLLMFPMGFAIHSIFNINSRLGYKMGITADANGTGLAPYANY